MFADRITVSLPGERAAAAAGNGVLKGAQLRRHSKTSDIYIYLGKLMIRGAGIHTYNTELMIILTLCLISCTECHLNAGCYSGEQTTLSCSTSRTSNMQTMMQIYIS